MKKEVLILFLILASTMVLAADVPRERIVTTNLNISGTSWIENTTCNPDTNETTGNSMMNVSIDTEDKGSNYHIEIGPTNSFGPNLYSIMFTQWMSCEDVLDNILLNQTVDMFSSCNGNNCKTEYENCNTSKGSVELSKQEVDAELAECKTNRTDMLGVLEACNGNQSDYNNKVLELQTCNNQLDEQDKTSPIVYYILCVAGGIGLVLAYQAYQKRDKTHRGIDEKRHGAREYSRKPWEEDLPKEVKDYTVGGPNAP